MAREPTDEELDRAEKDIELALQHRIKAAMTQFREQRGWDRARMAEELGITIDHYIRYETGNLWDVPIVVTVRFCELAGVDIIEFLRERPH